MSKKHFIMLADVIKDSRNESYKFSESQIEILSRFCQSQNSNFKADRWISYIKGECGQNGGNVKS